MDRDNIINEYSKKEFMDFLNFDHTGKILELLNEEGIQILKKSKLKEERIEYILAFTKYKNELLQNIDFLDVLLKTKISYYRESFKGLDTQTYDIILKRNIELDKDPWMIASLFSYFDTNYKLQALEHWKYSEELLYCVLKIDEPCIVNKIIDNYPIDLLKYDIGLKSFFQNAKESVVNAKYKKNVENKMASEINIPTKMITKEIAEKIWDEYDIFTARSIINNAQYCTDPSIINEYIKYKEDQLISNCNNKTILSPFKEILEAFKRYKIEELKLKKDQVKDEEDYFNSRRAYIRNISKSGIEDIRENMENRYTENGIEAVEEYLCRLSENKLSNYIIDYLFEENYYNIMLDLRELLDFYYQGNIAIPSERIEIYDRISNIDDLPIEEKVELYKYLKNFNMVETFYDDMRMARYIVGEAIKEYSLSSQTIKQYKDEKLSKMHGVDVYNMNGQPFFGIVKTGRREKDKFPTGHSYSLIGDGGIAVFGDPKDSKTYLYDSDDMNPEQLVHVFPYDAFTGYHPFTGSEKATSRVNNLIMPEELVTTSEYYNELLLLERGSKETTIDNSIPELKKIALYCLDEIREQDIEIAKNNNVGIVLINSKKYKKTKENSFNIHTHAGINDWEYNYYDSHYKEKFESRR